MSEFHAGYILEDGRIIDRRGLAQSGHAIVPTPSLEQHQKYKKHGWVELRTGQGETSYQRRKV